MHCVKSAVTPFRRVPCKRLPGGSRERLVDSGVTGNTCCTNNYAVFVAVVAALQVFCWNGGVRAQQALLFASSGAHADGAARLPDATNQCLWR